MPLTTNHAPTSPARVISFNIDHALAEARRIFYSNAVPDHTFEALVAYNATLHRLTLLVDAAIAMLALRRELAHEQDARNDEEEAILSEAVKLRAMIHERIATIHKAENYLLARHKPKGDLLAA